MSFLILRRGVHPATHVMKREKFPRKRVASTAGLLSSHIRMMLRC